jgi:mono/diheme cytochrome c family protein
MPVHATHRYFLLLLCLYCIPCSASDTASIDTAAWQEGRSLFKANCSSCHNPVVAQTGPALIGVTKRWEDAGHFGGKTGKQWLYAWIRNWTEPVKAGYPYAVKIQNYSPSQMSVFNSLTDSEIDKILLYVENPQVSSKPTVCYFEPEKKADWGYTVIYILLALVAGALLILFLVLPNKRKSPPK